MDDQLDNDLKNHIREVFDNYEDTTADEGWLLLREKFPAEKKRRGIAWIWWAAAVLLVCTGIGLWLKTSTDKPATQIAKQKSQPIKHGKPAAQQPMTDTVNDNHIAATVPSKPSDQQIASAPVLTGKTTHRNTQNLATTHQKRLSPDVGKPDKTSTQPQLTVVNKQIPANNQAQIIQGDKQISSTSAAIAQTTKPADQQATATMPAPANTAATNTNPVAVQQPKPQKDIMDMFKHDQGNKQPAKDVNEQKNKKVNFGLYAGTYFNYGKGSDNQVNVGGGVTSDIKLNRKLKLVTGITIAQNSMSYQAIPTTAASLRSNLAVPAAVTSNNMYATLASTPTIRNYNANLVGLDIPINLKYEFNPDKTDAYLSLGLSSGTFIDESYTYKYNYPPFQSSSLKETRNETTSNNFNSFYFAKTLNVAFGVGYPFGKNRLVIEPFLKYPLDGLGSQNLKFGAGGLNLKFNFLSSHK